MTDDLVKCLRDSCYLAFDDGTNDYGAADEAADRIEKLEAALDDALQYVSSADWHYLKDETRKALEGEDG